jgi:hypothetical protein
MAGVPDIGCAQCDSARLRSRPASVLAFLASIQLLAFVRDELFLDAGVCILRSAYSLGIYRELGIAIFTHAMHRNIILSFDDPKLAFRHAQVSQRTNPIAILWKFKVHHCRSSK